MSQPNPDQGRDFTAVLPQLLLLTGIFFINFLARVALSPLMPALEREMGFSHAQAGAVFMYQAVGTSLGLLANSFLSERHSHRVAILTSTLGLTGGMFLAATCQSLFTLKAAAAGLGFAAGVYIPSGLATVTALARRKDWGKAMSVHEAAPNSGFILAPLLVEAVLAVWPWNLVFIVLGVAGLLMGLGYYLKGRGGQARGRALRPAVALPLLRLPFFWLMAGWFCVAVGVSLGPYSMIPLSLISGHGYTRESANQLLAWSRLAALPMAFLAGYVTDQFGVRRTLAAYFLLAGLATLGLGLADGPALTVMCLIQPALSVGFFPPAFTILSFMFEDDIRGSAIALLTPLSAFMGVGVIPAFIGYLGDQGRFDLGFLILGATTLGCLLLLPLLRLKKGEWEALNQPQSGT